MTDSELDELERLHEAATPSDWHVVPLAGNIEHSVVGMLGGYVSEICVTIPKEDAALIVAARNALPGLIAAVREGRAERSGPEWTCADCGEQGTPNNIVYDTEAGREYDAECPCCGSLDVRESPAEAAGALAEKRSELLSERDAALKERDVARATVREVSADRDEFDKMFQEKHGELVVALQERDALRAEVERLRAEQVECPFCEQVMALKRVESEFAVSRRIWEHASICPAFNPDGTVRRGGA